MYQTVTKAPSPPFQSTLFHPTSHLKTDRKRTSAEVRFVVAPASEGVARTTGGNYGTHIYDPLWVGQNDLNININPRKGCPTHKGSWVLVALFTPIHRLYEPRMGATTNRTSSRRSLRIEIPMDTTRQDLSNA